MNQRKLINDYTLKNDHKYKFTSYLQKYEYHKVNSFFY